MERKTTHLAEKLQSKSGKGVFISEGISFEENQEPTYQFNYVWANRKREMSPEIHSGCFAKEQELQDKLQELYESVKEN